MGQAQPLQPTALVVEDEPLQSALASTLLEEADFTVIECQSAEAALAVLQETSVVLVFADVNLAGTIDGLELATIVHESYPRTAVVVTSGNIGERVNELPEGIEFMQKPWLPLDLLIAAERVRAR